MQGTWVQFLVKEDSTCLGATKPVYHSYWNPNALEPVLHNKWSHRNKKPAQQWRPSVVQLLSRVQLLETPWTAACQASLSFTNSWSLLRLMSIKSVMPSNHLILCHPLLLPQSFPASGSFPMSQLFASGGQSIGASASASVLPMNIQDWFPLEWTGLTSLQCKGVSSLLQHHSSKASILLCSAFFTVQLSHLYMTSGKTIALSRWPLSAK